MSLLINDNTVPSYPLRNILSVYTDSNSGWWPILCIQVCQMNGGYELTRVMRKTAFFICENKDAVQIRGHREADQRLCFSYTDSTIPLLPISEISPSHLLWLYSPVRVGTPEDRLSHNEAQLLIGCFFFFLS